MLPAAFSEGFMDGCADDLGCLSQRLLNNLEQALTQEHPDRAALDVLMELMETFLNAAGENIDQDSAAYIDFGRWGTLLSSVNHPKTLSLNALLVALQQRQQQAPYTKLPYLLRNLASCDLNFHYSDWNAPHAFFTANRLKPFRGEGETYAFRVKENVFGLPVSGLIVPGTWGVYGIAFDAPADQVATALRQHLQGHFTANGEPEIVGKPKLTVADEFLGLPVLFCDEEVSDGAEGI